MRCSQNAKKNIWKKRNCCGSVDVAGVSLFCVCVFTVMWKTICATKIERIKLDDRIEDSNVARSERASHSPGLAWILCTQLPRIESNNNEKSSTRSTKPFGHCFFFSLPTETIAIVVAITPAAPPTPVAVHLIQYFCRNESIATPLISFTGARNAQQITRFPYCTKN